MESTVAYNWTEFRLHHYYHCTRKELFAAWATSAGLESFFIKQSIFTAKDGTVRQKNEPAQAGDAYKWDWIHNYSLTGTIFDVTPNEAVVFSFGSMRVKVAISGNDGELLLTLSQTDIPVDNEDNKAWSHLNCRSCWAHYLTNLKAVLEHGIDLREPDADRADCISIGFVPQ
ncbi:MAG: SRPBCC domain-containing protein [Candidatus Zixiibacteriota bacterium]